MRVAGMIDSRRFQGLGAGLLAGVVGSLVMTLAMVLLRYALGVATPAELTGDRLAPDAYRVGALHKPHRRVTPGSQ